MRVTENCTQLGIGRRHTYQIIYCTSLAFAQRVITALLCVMSQTLGLRHTSQLGKILVRCLWLRNSNGDFLSSKARCSKQLRRWHGIKHKRHQEIAGAAYRRVRANGQGAHGLFLCAKSCEGFRTQHQWFSEFWPRPWQLTWKRSEKFTGCL